MEAPWVRQTRVISEKQAQSFVDGTINEEHHIVFKRRDGSEVDAGEIKLKDRGMLVYVTSEGDLINEPTYKGFEPNIYILKDGYSWSPVPSQGHFISEVGKSNVDAGCWTGDRFVLGIMQKRFSWRTYTLLQSRDGGNWVYHPDEVTFDPDYFGMYIRSIRATGTGLVVAVGQYFGEDHNSSIAMSYDFGETWEVLP
jgi:hypothetical protein